MLNSAPVSKDNLKVLGLLVRYKRINLGYSLRDLGEIAKISHTMISNFERGIMIPNHETIKDIFKVLELDFYINHEVLKDFNKVFTDIFNHLLYYEYGKAAVLINKIEKNKTIYENSKEVINFTIIRCLYYVLTNTYIKEKDKILEQYEVVLEFFSDNQKKMFFFIKGLNCLNIENYKYSRLYFEKALKIGDSSLDLLIKEHYVVALSKSDKFIDARMLAEECTLEFEKSTNYIRAMRSRSRIAHDYIKKRKFKEAKEIYNLVYAFSIKYNVKDLENRCNTRLAQIAALEGKNELAKTYLDKVTPVFSKAYYYLQFDSIVQSKDEKKFLDYYDKVMKEEWVLKHEKSYNFFKMIKMRFNDKYMDKKEYDRLIQVQTNIAIRSDDAEMLEHLTLLAIDFYKKERHYKKAMEAAETQIHYLIYGA